MDCARAQDKVYHNEQGVPETALRHFGRRMKGSDLCMQVSCLHVLEDMQGRGIGRSLLDTARAYAVSQR